MNLSFISGIFSLVLGIGYTIVAFGLEKAAIGRPLEPRIFPVMLGVSLIVLSIVMIAKEIAKGEVKQKTEKGTEKKRSNLVRILLTALLSVIYAFLFDRVGYVISTVLFLEGVLWVFNGIEKWKTNTIVALVFSLFIYILFAKLLGVYLPMTPGIWI